MTVDPLHGLTCALAPTAKRRRPQGRPRYLLDFDPRNLPDKYAMAVDGVCMEPEIPNGTMLLLDRTQRPKPGDLVAFFYRRERVPKGEYQARVKRLASVMPDEVTFHYSDHPGSEVVQVLMFEMNNPRGQFAVRCSDLIAVHKCLGPAAPGTTHKMSKQERAELRVSHGMPAI